MIYSDLYGFIWTKSNYCTDQLNHLTPHELNHHVQAGIQSWLPPKCHSYPLIVNNHVPKNWNPNSPILEMSWTLVDHYFVAWLMMQMQNTLEIINTEEAGSTCTLRCVFVTFGMPLPLCSLPSFEKMRTKVDEKSISTLWPGLLLPSQPFLWHSQHLWLKAALSPRNQPVITSPYY